MDTRKNRWKANHLVGHEDGLTAGLLAALAGRMPRKVGRVVQARPAAMSWSGAETLEPRIMMDGDHPGFPVPFTPGVGTVVTIDGTTGRGTATGTISAPVAGNPDDDTFRFTVTNRDFVTVLANTAGLGSNLNSAVTVYNSAGVAVATGTNNGPLTSVAPQLARDGWVGFIADPGEYYVQVTGESGTTGNYELRVDAITSDIGVTIPLEDDDPAAPDPARIFRPTAGEFWIEAEVDELQGETVFFVDVPNDPLFNSIGSISTKALSTEIDARIEVYNSLGVLIASDSDAGYLNNSYAAFRVIPGERLYVRIRSDDLLDTQQSIGEITARVDLVGADLSTPVDPVTRRGSDSGHAMIGDFNLADPDFPDVLIGPTDSDLYVFQAQGTGLTVITLVDQAFEGGFGLYLYNSLGEQIAFDDDFVGNAPQIEVDLVGGERYWIVVSSFEPPQTPVPLDAAPYSLFIEAHHTTDETVPVDDHVNTPAGGTPADVARRQFELATPMQWNDPRLYRDANNNPIYDRAWVTDATVTGRVHDADDTDLFSFVAPVNMMGTYEGNNDDEGTALYVGGAFGVADPDSVFSTNSAGLAAWDAGDWWFTGELGTEDDPLGFLDNPNTVGTAEAQIYAMHAFQQVNRTGQPVLIVGGDFELHFTNPFTGEVNIATNLAAWGFNTQLGRYHWFSIGNPNAPVRAITEFDPVADGNNPDPGPNQLIIGGDFTQIALPGPPPPQTVAANRIAGFTLGGPIPFDITYPSGLANATINGTWAGLGTGTTGPVHALAVYDAEDPGEGRDADPPLPAVADPADPVLSLFIGGAFNNAGGVAVNNFARWDGAAYSAVNFGTPAQNGNVNGPVHVIKVWDPADPDDAESTTGQPVLVVGGEFTNAGGVAVNNIFMYGRVASIADGDPNTDPEAVVYQPRLLYEALGDGTNDAVFALATFPAGEDTDAGEILLVGGAFTEADGGEALRVASFDRDGGWAQIADGFDETVFTLAVVTDVQEPGVADDAPAIYAGGAFENSGAFATSRAARLTAQGWRGLNSGTDGPVFAMTAYDDGNPNEWDRNDRPSSRVLITLAPTDGAFLNTFVRVYDSNLNLVYSNNTKNPIGPDPSGTNDPSLAPGVTTFIMPELWAGETYYVEVSSETQGFRNTGRYNLTVTVDAVPPDVDEDGALDNPVATYFEEPDAEEWVDALRIDVDSNFHGDGSNQTFVETQGGAPPVTPAGGNNGQRFNYPRTPSAAIGATPSRFFTSEAADFGNIDSVTDTDLYFFRAASTGYVEIRINTTNIQQMLFERIWDLNTVPPSAQETVIGAHAMNSPLQSVLRVFDNDETEVAVSGFNPAIGGESDTTTTGRFGSRTYTNRDARVVVPVQANRIYFIQVESGQAPIFAADPTLVDWRYATGTYELLVDSIGDFTPDNADDVHNFIDLASPIPVGIDPTNPATNGRGMVTAQIRDVVNNPFEVNDDRDLFFYYATGDGPITLTASARNSNVSLSITVLNDTQGVVATGLATPGGSIVINWVGERGQRFYVQADGAGGTQGAYQLEIVGVPYADDHANVGSWINATPLTVNPFLGTAVATGRIESAGDTDLFVFTSDQWSMASITVESLSPNTLDPFVRVYEIQEDLSGNQYFAQVVFNDDTAQGNTNSFGRFSISPGRTYYIMVQGFDPNLDFGNYQLTTRLTPTDDHPNRQFFPLATVLNPALDPSGYSVANATGRIEVEADDDVFRFSAAAGGVATVTITRTAGDFDPLLRVQDGAGNELAGSPVGDTTTPGTVSYTFNVVRGQTYYIVVDVDIDGGTGTYSLNLQAPANDDHANEGEFGLASVVTLSSTTGVGTRTGSILPAVDTDLFRFNARVVGNATITITTPSSLLNPRIRVYDSNFVLIPGSSDDTETATQVVSATAVNQAFYVLVLSDNVGGGSQTGSYEIRVQQTIDGPGPGPGPGDDDHANAGNFANASPVSIDSRTGDGSIAGIINAIGDTDLFRFVTPELTNNQTGQRPVFLQVTTPSGGLVDGILRVFRESTANPGQFDEIGSNSNGTPGSTASFQFDSLGNATYYVLVEPVGASTGSYTLRVDTEPNTHYLYYPEGYTADTIDEFVPIVNPNNFDVTYTVVARYEVGERDQILVENAVIPANSRGGFTVTSRGQQSLTRRDTPYALEIMANGQLGATFAHYDFGVTTGENFTNRTSTTWNFAQVNRDGVADPTAVSNLFNDYVVFYNPNNFDVTVNVTMVYDNGTVNSFSRTVGALRRGGLNFDTDDAVNLSGRFSVRLSSSAAIVAGLSSYDIQNGRGYGLLGDADAGATAGVVPNISSGNGVESSIALYNSTNTTATITLTASYTQANLPDLVRVISLSSNSRRTFTLAELGLINSQAAGIRYTSNVPVTVNAIEYKNGDGDATAAATYAGTTAIFGDAFVTPEGAGNTYIEQIGLYNPSGTASTVAIRFLFTDGTESAPVNVNVGARGFALFQVDQAAAILNGATAAFSIRLDSAIPFVASFTHYDLFLGGGWSTNGALIGLTNPLATIG